MRVRVFFSFMVIDSSAENGQHAREHATQSHIRSHMLSLFMMRQIDSYPLEHNIIHLLWVFVCVFFFNLYTYTRRLACNKCGALYVLNMCLTC